MARGRRPVVRANREWTSSLVESDLLLDDTSPQAYQLLLGDNTERPELGIEPKVLRIHGVMKFQFNLSNTGFPNPLDVYSPKVYWGVCIADRDAFEDFLLTGNTFGLPELFDDASHAGWMMWGVFHMCPKFTLVGSPEPPSQVLEEQISPMCHQVVLDVRAQRRVPKEMCILAAVDWHNFTNVENLRWQCDARLLVTQ